MNPKLTSIVVAVLVVANIATPVAAGTDSEPSLTVTLSEDGSAEVTLTLTYNLQSDAEQDAFRTLEEDADTRQRIRKQFRDRMATVAASAANATGREMSVGNATIDVQTTEDNQTGVVELSVTWNGLAAVEGDRLIVTQPFASGFETDRPVTLVAPEGYELANAIPDPATVQNGRVTWKPGTNLDGFTVTFQPDTAGPTQQTTEQTVQTPTETAITDQTTDRKAASTSNVPGFGLAVGITSLLGAVVLWLRQ